MNSPTWKLFSLALKAAYYNWGLIHNSRGLGKAKQPGNHVSISTWL